MHRRHPLAAFWAAFPTRRCGLRWPLLLPLSLLPGLVSTAMGAPLRDAATGLAVDPPTAYAAIPISPSGDQTARFAIRRAGETDTGCQVAYVPAPQNAGLTQERLNALTRSPGWQAVTRAQIGTAYQLLEGRTFEHGGITGLELVGDLRPRAGLPERTMALRSLFSIQETPRGRTTAVCVAEKSEFPVRRAEFQAVLRSIAPPR